MQRRPDLDAAIAAHLQQLTQGGLLLRTRKGSAFGVCFQARAAVAQHVVGLKWADHYASGALSGAGDAAANYATALLFTALRDFGYSGSFNPLGDYYDQPSSERWVGQRGERRRQLAGQLAAWINTNPEKEL